MVDTVSDSRDYQEVFCLRVQEERQTDKHTTAIQHSPALFPIMWLREYQQHVGIVRMENLRSYPRPTGSKPGFLIRTPGDLYAYEKFEKFCQS